MMYAYTVSFVNNKCLLNKYSKKLPFLVNVQKGLTNVTPTQLQQILIYKTEIGLLRHHNDVV